MNIFEKIQRRLKEFIFGEPKPQPKISLLVPFKSDNRERKRAFRWLREYWKHELPEAEFIVGHSRSTPFCKTEALNNAADKATGKVLVILDADAYLDGEVIERCADRIIEELDNHLWYVPYRKLYRLNKRATYIITSTDPADPMEIPNPPPDDWLDDNGHKAGYGHRYGAMVMMFPREALDTLGCFDERFRGWGGEDVALLRALDTLWGKHKTTRNPIYHLWHPVIGEDYRSRMWAGQERQYNSNLAMRYHRATRHPSKMRHLVDEGCRHNKRLLHDWIREKNEDGW